MTSRKAKVCGSELNFDRGATAAAYEVLGGPDPSCCTACSAFVAVVAQGALPDSVVATLDRLGVDVAKPQEVYGTPEAGHLAGWWLLVGALNSSWAGEAEGAYEEFASGFRCYITDRVVVRSWPPSTSTTDLVQLEFEWVWDVSDGNSPSAGWARRLERSSPSGQ